MSHQRPVYVIDRNLAARRILTAHLASLDAEAWPFSGGYEFLAIFDHLAPACILLDMDTPSPTGLEVMAELARRQADWPVVAMSGRRDVEVAVEAMKLGAIDFLEKPIDAGKLSAALSLAWTALKVSIETREVRCMAQERVSRLTAREVDISLALFSGQSNKAVAHEFGISVRTVEMHRAHIMAKLEVKNLAEAVVLASQAGLVAGPVGCPPPAGPLASAAVRARLLPSPVDTMSSRRLAMRSSH